MALYNPVNAVWRQMYSPLFGLNMGRIVSMLVQAELGYYGDLTWCYRFIEKRDSILRAVRNKRIAALKRIDFQVKVKTNPNIDAKKAARQQAFLQGLYDNIDNLKDAVGWMGVAEFRGFAHLEKHYDNNGMVYHLEPVPQWFFCKKFPSQLFLFNERALQTTAGVPIDYNDFIIREIDCPINEIAIIAFMRKNLSYKNFDVFVETYGIPPLFIELPAGVGKTEEYQSMADRVIGDGRGVVGNGAKVITVDTGLRGQTPFLPHIDLQNRDIVMAATGGLLTTISQPTGMNDDQAQIHERAFASIAEAEALEISEVFQKQFDKPALEQEFPGEPVLAYAEWSMNEIESDQGIVQDAVQLGQIGLAIDPEQIQERTGYKLSKIQMPQPMGGQDDSQYSDGGDGGYGGESGENSENYDDDEQPNVPYFNNRLMNNPYVHGRRIVKSRCKRVVDAIRNVGKLGDASTLKALERLSADMPDLIVN